MKDFTFLKNWKDLLHWKGWHGAAAFFARVGNTIVSWTIWQKLFALPFLWVLLMSALCATGLIWGFVNSLETWIPAYFLYTLSAYCLTALCVKLPATVRSAKEWVSRHPKLSVF